MVNQKNLHDFLAFGDKVILESRQLILSLWSMNSIHSELKEDNTPVSEVDLKCEELARDLIRKAFPSHGIIGEELGAEREDAEFVWTIDPIDGTQNLINRIPTFGTILGLLHFGRPLLGWIDHPVLGDTLRGGVGVGTFHNGKQILVEDLVTKQLTHNDIIATNCPSTFTQGNLGVLWKILNFHPHVRIYYDVYTASTKEFPKMWEERSSMSPPPLNLGGRGGACDDGTYEGGNNIYHKKITAGRVTKERESFPLP